LRRGRVVSSERVMDLQDRILSDGQFAVEFADRKLAHMRGHLRDYIDADNAFAIAGCRAGIDELLEVRSFFQSRIV
jgi:hypothetical protein